MPYYLNFAPTLNHVTIPGVTLSGDWEVVVDIAAEHDPQNIDNAFLGDGGSSYANFFALLRNSNQVRIRASNTTYNFSCPITVGERAVIRLVCSGGVTECYKDGILRSWLNVTPVFSLPLTRIGRLVNDIYAQRLYSLAISTPTGNRLYSAENVSSGTVLPDLLNSANNGTLVSFPTDNSQWVFYSSGGASFPYTAAGGAVFSGEATTAKIAPTSSSFVYAGAGGSLFSGIAVLKRIRRVVATGGASVSGTAETAKIAAPVLGAFQYTGAGGSAAGGAALLKRTCFLRAEGGLTLSGVAGLTRIRSLQALGSIAISGSASTAKAAVGQSALVHIGTGGILPIAGAALLRRTKVFSSIAPAPAASSSATAEQIAKAVHEYIIENGKTFEQMMRIQYAVLAGKVFGAGTDTERFRDIADTKDRLIVTADEFGNRTGIVADGT